jgi:hypothetical protein
MAVTAPVRHSVALNGYPYMCQICKAIGCLFTRHYRGIYAAHWIYGRQFEDYLDQICTVGQAVACNPHNKFVG